MSGSDSSDRALRALTYIKGVSQGLEVAAIVTKHNGGRILGAYCGGPTEVTTAQLYSIVKKGLAKEPEVRHKDSAFLVYLYLAEVFPCRAK